MTIIKHTFLILRRILPPYKRVSEPNIMDNKVNRISLKKSIKKGRCEASFLKCQYLCILKSNHKGRHEAVLKW